MRQTVATAVDQGLSVMLTERQVALYDPRTTTLVGSIRFNRDIVQNSVAVNGYGPLLYEVAMSENWLTPSRLSVSLDAREVWRKFEQRTDVLQRPTSRHFNLPELSYLNKSYKLKAPLSLEKLVVAQPDEDIVCFLEVQESELYRRLHRQ